MSSDISGGHASSTCKHGVQPSFCTHCRLVQPHAHAPLLRAELISRMPPRARIPYAVNGRHTMSSRRRARNAQRAFCAPWVASWTPLVQTAICAREPALGLGYDLSVLPVGSIIAAGGKLDPYLRSSACDLEPSQRYDRLLTILTLCFPAELHVAQCA